MEKVWFRQSPESSALEPIHRDMIETLHHDVSTRMKLPDILTLARTLFQTTYGARREVERVPPLTMDWLIKTDRLLLEKGAMRWTVMCTEAQEVPMIARLLRPHDVIYLKWNDGAQYAEGMLQSVCDGGNRLAVSVVGAPRELHRLSGMTYAAIGTSSPTYNLEWCGTLYRLQGSMLRARTVCHAKPLRPCKGCGHVHADSIPCPKDVAANEQARRDARGDKVLCPHCHERHSWGQARETIARAPLDAYVRKTSAETLLQMYVEMEEEERYDALVPLRVLISENAFHDATLCSEDDREFRGVAHTGPYCTSCCRDDMLAKDAKQGDLVCHQCGSLVVDNIERGQQFRKHEGEVDRNHHGSAWNPLLSDEYNMNSGGHGKGTYHDEVKIRAFALLNRLSAPHIKVVTSPPTVAAITASSRSEIPSVEQWEQRVCEAQREYEAAKIAVARLPGDGNSVQGVLQHLLQQVFLRVSRRDLTEAQEALRRRQLTAVQLHREVERRSKMEGARARAQHERYLQKIQPELQALEAQARSTHSTHTQQLDGVEHITVKAAYTPATIDEAKRLFSLYRDSVKRITHFHSAVSACVIAAYWRIIDEHLHPPGGSAEMVPVASASPPDDAPEGEWWRVLWTRCAVLFKKRAMVDLEYDAPPLACLFCTAMKQFKSSEGESHQEKLASTVVDHTCQGLNTHLPKNHPLFQDDESTEASAAAASPMTLHLEVGVQKIRGTYPPPVRESPTTLLKPDGVLRRVLGLCLSDEHLHLITTMLHSPENLIREYHVTTTCQHPACTRTATSGVVEDGQYRVVCCEKHLSADMLKRQSLIELWMLGLVECAVHGFPCAACQEPCSIPARCWTLAPPEMLLRTVTDNLRVMLEQHESAPLASANSDATQRLSDYVSQLDALKMVGADIDWQGEPGQIAQWSGEHGRYRTTSGTLLTYDEAKRAREEAHRRRAAQPQQRPRQKARRIKERRHFRESVRSYHGVAFPSSDQELPHGWRQSVVRENHAPRVFPWGTSHINRIVYMSSSGKRYTPPYDAHICTWELDDGEWLQYVHDDATREDCDLVAYLHVPTLSTQWQPPAHWPPLPAGWAQRVKRSTGEIFFVKGTHVQQGFPVRHAPGQPAPQIPWRHQPDGRLVIHDDASTKPSASEALGDALSVIRHAAKPFRENAAETRQSSSSAKDSPAKLMLVKKKLKTEHRQFRPLCSIASSWRCHVGAHNQRILGEARGRAMTILREINARLVRAVRERVLFPPVAEKYAHDLLRACMQHVESLQESAKHYQPLRLPERTRAALPSMPPETPTHALEQWAAQQVQHLREAGSLPSEWEVQVPFVTRFPAFETCTVQVSYGGNSRPQRVLHQYATLVRDAGLTKRERSIIRPTVRPWAHQREVLASIQTPDRAVVRSGILVVPCGGGKTLIGILATANIGPRTKCLVLCHNMASVEQWVEQYLRWTTLSPSCVYGIGLKPGMNLATILRANIVVTTYQRLANARKSEAGKRLIKLLDLQWDMVFLDEAHIVPAEGTLRLITELRARAKIGATATLLREDDGIECLKRAVGPVLHRIDWRRLTREGYIATIDCIQVLCPMSEVARDVYARTCAASTSLDNHNHLKARLISAMNHHKFNLCSALMHYHLAEGHNVVLFFEELHAMQHYARHLRDQAGHPLVFIQSEEPEEKKLRSLQLFRAGKIRVLCFSRTGDSSIDLPNANVGIQISSHRKSRRQEKQRMGRISRKVCVGQRPQKGQKSESFFYTLISEGTKEQEERAYREQHLREEGYTLREIPGRTCPPHLSPHFCAFPCDEARYYRNIEKLRTRDIADANTIEATLSKHSKSRKGLRARMLGKR